MKTDKNEWKVMKNDEKWMKIVCLNTSVPFPKKCYFDEKCEWKMNEMNVFWWRMKWIIETIWTRKLWDELMSFWGSEMEILMTKNEHLTGWFCDNCACSKNRKDEN